MTFGLAAAGTGGHIYPALSVADALVESGVPKDEIVFFGGDRLEAVLVPEAGYRLVQLPLRGLERRLTTRNLAIPATVRRAAKIVSDTLDGTGPGSLLALGGYVTVPTVWGARRAGVPTMLHEQNAVPGLANRLMARFAIRVFVAFPEARETLKRGEVVGNPLRPAFTRFDRGGLRDAARQRYGLGAAKSVIGILGGSQGARVLNEAAAEIASTRSEGAGILHLAGTSNLANVEAMADGHDLWKVMGFESAMDDFYAACDVVVSRAGALTMSEVAATATPAVVVPYAAGTAGHQAANAFALAAAGGVVVIAEDGVADLVPTVMEIVEDSNRLHRMATALSSHGRTDAAETIAGAMVEAASR